MPSRFSRNIPFVAVILVIVGVGVVHMLRFNVVLDDSYISLRTAKHWVEYGVPVYNPGVREWVPTTPLWVALNALWYALLRLPLPTISQALGALCGISILLGVCAALLGTPARRASLYAAALCAGSSIWAAWPLSGMETSLFAVSVLAGVICVLRYLDQRSRNILLWAGVAFAIATATRPDGLLLFVTTALFLILFARDWRHVAGFVFVYGLVILPQLLYLQFVFGSVLPNSYYTKVHGLANLDRGLQYMTSALRELRVLYWLPVVVLPAFLSTWRKRAAYLGSMVIAWLTWVVIIGGDFMLFHRFLHPILPVLCLSIGLGLSSLGRLITRWRPALRTVALVAPAVLAILVIYHWSAPSLKATSRVRFNGWAEKESTRATIGKWLARRYTAQDWLAVKPAGIIPFYAGMPAIDFFCIVDRQAAQTGQTVPGALVGHQKMNARRIHDIGPKVVILDDTLYPHDKLPPPGYTDPNHGGSWLRDPRVARYRAVRAEVAPDLWMNYFEMMVQN
jgi:hypothetical protein